MITIFSIESDQSTNDVLDWLSFYNAEWIRVNAEDLEEKEVDEVFLNDGKTKVVWFRKWKKAADYITCKTSHSYIEINKGREFEEYSKYLFNSFKSKFWLNSPDNWSADKLSQLKKAKEVGLLVPPTIFTGQKKKLQNFFDSHKNLITKNFAANILIIEVDEGYINYTSSITKKDIDSLDENFYPSLFQKKIDKEYEVRSFFLDGEISSMAIFSQNDKQTSIDFRQYNLEKPNRNIPFQLPSEIEDKVKALMNQFKINCGSLDFIREPSGELYFLEINPLGQFGMTSYPCNYFIEKKIAKYLIEKRNEN